MRNDARKAMKRLGLGAVLAMVTASNTTIAQDELPLVSAQRSQDYGTYPGDGLSMPTDVAVSADGRVYVVDSGRHRIATYDADGSSLGYFGTEGGDEGQLSGPVGIDVDGKGNVYVADKDNKRLQVFEADGSFDRSLAVEEAGSGAEPVDVAVSAKGRTLYVTTNDTHKVLALTSRGNFERAWGEKGSEPGQFHYPATIKVDAADKVYVVDALNARVRVFDKDGTSALIFGKYGANPGSFIRPKGVAVDAGGRIYVSDSYLGVVQVFDTDGTFIGALGVDGEVVRFEAPTGLAIRGSRLYVTDMLAGKVLAFDVEGAR